MSGKYGVNLAHAENTISNLKTAKMNRDKTRRAFEREDLEDEAYGNYLSKSNPDEIIKATDTNQDGIVDEAETQNALRKTGKKFGAIKKITDKKEISANRANVISNRNSRTASANNRRSVLNRATNAAEKRANQRVTDTENRLMNYAETASAVAAENGATPKEQELIKQRVLNKKKEYDKTFGNYLDEKNVMTKLATLDAVGKSAMGAKNATEANKALKDLNKEYTQALEDGNSGVAEILKDVIEDIPSNFTDEKFANQKAEMLAETTLATDYIESRAEQAKIIKGTGEAEDKPSFSNIRLKEKDALSYAKTRQEDKEFSTPEEKKINAEVSKLSRSMIAKSNEEIYQKAKARVTKLKESVDTGKKAVPKWKKYDN